MLFDKIRQPALYEKFPEIPVIERLEDYRREGAEAWHSGATCPYPGNTLKHYMHSQGWLCEDLRQALIKSNPTYARSQQGI